jgi:hypothetical protein
MSLTIELEIISDKLDEAMEEIRVFYADHGDIEEWDWNILESDMLSNKFHKKYGDENRYSQHFYPFDPKPFAINFIPREED